MRFIDADVSIYAIVKPKREASEEIIDAKNRAKKIIERVEAGEPVLTSIIHLSEVANILEEYLRPETIHGYFNSILYKENITIRSVDRELYRLANEAAFTYSVGLNDAVALVLMRRERIGEIYSFDKHLDKIDFIKRLTY